jgi:hypothetical protein
MWRRRIGGREADVAVRQRRTDPADRPAQALLALIYWGPRLLAQRNVGQIGFLAQRAVPHGRLDAGEVFDLFRRFSGHPAIVAHAALMDEFNGRGGLSSRARPILRAGDVAVLHLEPLAARR